MVSNLFADSVRNIHGGDIPYLNEGELESAFCFHLGLLDPFIFPKKELIEIIMTSKTIDWNTAFQYSQCAGLSKMRYAIQKILRFRGQNVDLRNIFITYGCSEGFDLVPELLIDPGDVIYCENPTYPWALRAFNIHRAHVEFVKMDSNGINILDLEKRIKKQKRPSKLIYTIPNFQNPTGISLSLNKRREIVYLAKKYNLIILEDDPYYHLRYQGKTLPSLYELDNQRVIHLGTFSKSIGGGIRLGWLLANEEIVDRLSKIKHTGTTTFLNEIVSEYITGPFFLKNIEKIRSYFKKKFDLAMSSLQKTQLGDILFSRPDGGFFFWMKMPTQLDVMEFKANLKKKNLYVLFGENFSPDPEFKRYFRFSISYENSERINTGLEILGNIYSNTNQ